MSYGDDDGSIPEIPDTALVIAFTTISVVLRSSQHGGHFSSRFSTKKEYTYSTYRPTYLFVRLI